MKASRAFRNVSGGLAALLIVTVIVVAANVIVNDLNIRKDLTEERLYQLSDGTRRILAALDQPVTVNFFFNRTNPEIPVPYKHFAQRVEDLLSEYELAGDGNIIVMRHNPEPDSDAEDWARRYGVTGRSLGFGGPVLYLGLVAVAGDTEAAIPILDPRQEKALEYLVTRMITRVANPDKPVVGVISSLPVLGSPGSPYPMPGQPQPQKPWFAFANLRQDYEVREIRDGARAIDEDVDALVLVHPKNLSDGTLYAIDQFVLRGGRLLGFIDAHSLVEAAGSQSMAPQMQFGSKASGLGGLLQAWGVSMPQGKVAADLYAPTLVPGADNTPEESLVWLSLKREHANGEDLLTSNLEAVLMPMAGTFTVKESDELEVTPLFSTSESSALVDAMTAQFSARGVRRDFVSGRKRLNLAVRLRGILHTAFPDGPPPAEDEGGQELPEGLSQSAGESIVILVGDADMLFDPLCVEEGLFGYQFRNDNIAFFDNAVEQVAGNIALVGIRTRGKTERPFEVVKALRDEAQEQYIQEETELQRKLEDAQSRLNELQARKDESQKFVLSPEQKAEIERFRAEEYEYEQALKDVRKKLRRKEDSLGLKIKLINILLMPALVCAVWIGFEVYRIRKRKSVR